MHDIHYDHGRPRALLRTGSGRPTSRKLERRTRHLAPARGRRGCLDRQSPPSTGLSPLCVCALTRQTDMRAQDMTMELATTHEAQLNTSASRWCALERGARSRVSRVLEVQEQLLAASARVDPIGSGALKGASSARVRARVHCAGLRDLHRSASALPASAWAARASVRSACK